MGKETAHLSGGRIQLNMLDEIIVDNFAGGGGASTGMELATGRIVKIAINHDLDAILMHKTNHPHTKHLQASVWDVDPVKECGGYPVGLAWFSPDCKHFSKAKGAALVDRNIRGLAWIVLRWAGTVRPRVIILENVEEFQTWGPVRRGKPIKKKAGQTFKRWKKQLSDLGYTIEHRELVAADYGAPTTRKRFVLVARCDGRPIVWPERTHDKDGADGLQKWRSAAEVIDWTQPCYSMQVDATGTMIDVFNAIGNMDADKQVAALKTLFGQWAIQGAAKLTGNLEQFTDALAMVNDPSLYTGSMEREFIIKASTSEAIDSMMANAFQAMKIDVGTAFLPAKKEISVALIDFMNQLRSMPELGEIAQQLATLFSQGVSGAAEALENAMPAIQKFLNYLVNNGPQVLSFLGKLAAAFTAMKFAPGIESLLRGAGGLVFGSKTGGSTHTGSGGIVGLMGNLFRGGQNVASGAAGMAGNAASWIQGFIGATRGTMAMNGASGIMGFLGTAASALTSGLGNTGIGQYLGGITSSLGNFLNTTGILGGLQATGGALGEILSGISQATGLTDLVNGGIGLARTGAGKVVGGVTTLASNVVNSAPVQAIGGFAGRVVNSAPVQGIASMASGAAGWLGNAIPAGASALGSIWGPMASGFGGLLSGALPIVGVISGIIAVVSILGDHLDDIRGIIQNVFGDAGVAVFDSFIGVLSNVGDFITGLFADGGVAAAMAPLRDAITGMFGDDAGAAFDGLVQVLQSVMGVVGQVVTFANTTVKPIIEQIFGFITQTVVPILLQTFTAAAPVISGIISNLGSAVMSCMQVIGSAIQIALPIIEGAISVVLSIASVVIPALLAGYEAFSSGLASIASAIQAVFQGIIDFVTGVFTGNWTQAWQGVQDIFRGIFEGLGALIKTPLNAVISIINKAIAGINGLGLTIPDWVPVIGGKSFSLNIPQMPMLAKGGFTNGPSIAGEAGTEAVISFQRSARASNIATWTKAGQMLGVSNKPARLGTFDADDGGPGWPTGNSGGPVTITYAPTIIIQGNASKEDVDAALRDDKARFDAWYEEKKRNERRTRW